jgi:DNA-damage-inducible protein J
VVICNTITEKEYEMAQISVRIDDQTKAEADELLNKMGLTISSAVSMFLRQVVLQRKIPFAISAQDDHFYDEANIAHIRKSLEQGKRGEYVTKTMQELEALAQ